MRICSNRKSRFSLPYPAGAKKIIRSPPPQRPDKPFRNFKLFFILRNRFYFLFRKIELFLKMRNKICIMSL